MILQAWNTFLSEVSPFRLGRIVQAQPGLMASVGAWPLSEVSRDALFGSGPDSGLAAPGLSQTFPEATSVFSWRLLSCSKCKPSPKAEILSTLEKVSTQDCFIF